MAELLLLCCIWLADSFRLCSAMGGGWLGCMADLDAGGETA